MTPWSFSLGRRYGEITLVPRASSRPSTDPAQDRGQRLVPVPPGPEPGDPDFHETSGDSFSHEPTTPRAAHRSAWSGCSTTAGRPTMHHGNSSPLDIRDVYAEWHG